MIEDASKAHARIGRAQRTETRDVRRKQLIEATIDSIAEHGLAGTTLTTVTESVSLSHGIVNFHFKSKERLLVETIGFLAAEHRAFWRERIAGSGAAPVEQLAALVEVNFHPRICNRRKLTVWFAFYGDPRYRKLYLEKCAHIDGSRLAETERLCRQINEDEPPAHVDPQMFAQTLEAFIDGLWLNMLLYPGSFSRKRARDECMAFLATSFPHHFQMPGGAEAEAS